MPYDYSNMSCSFINNSDEEDINIINIENENSGVTDYTKNLFELLIY